MTELVLLLFFNEIASWFA